MPIGDNDNAVQRLIESVSKPEPEVCPRPSFARTPAEKFLQRYAFPLTFLAAHVVVVRSMWRMARRGDRNVGKLSLFLLGFAELLMFWTFLPSALGAFETFYGAETFRRFYHAATPFTGSVLNILSGCDTFLTLLVCYEFRLVAENAKARALVSTLRRRICAYSIILLVSVAASAYTFAASYTTIMKCGGAKMDVRPVYLISMDLMRAGQYVFAAVVVAIPCALLTHTNARLARFVGYSTLPTEANELIAGNSKSDSSLSKLRVLLATLTVVFVLTHVLSLAPLFVSPPTVSFGTLLSLMSITNWALFLSRVVCYGLLHAVSSHLAKMGVVNVY